MIQSINPVCICGCGRKVTWNKNFKQFNKYLKGHTWKHKKGINHPTYGKHWNLTQEIKTKQRFAHLGMVFSAKHRQNLSISKTGENNPMFGRKHTEETRLKQREAKLDKNRTVESRKKQSISVTGTKNSMYGKHHTEKIKKDISLRLTGRKMSKEFKEKMRIRNRGEANPNYGNGDKIRGEKNPMYGKHHTEIVKQQMRNRWKDENFVNKLMKACTNKPTKPEWLLGIFLDKLFPNEYQYVGDFTFWIEGKNPDFININGQKKIIELFGNYWHRHGNPQDRIDHFKKYGFDTLIVWEKELKDVVKLERELQVFHNR